MQTATAVATVNPDYLHTVLAALLHRHHTLWRQRHSSPCFASPESPARHRPDGQQLSCLLQLLPRSFHPAIVQAFCSRAGHGAAFLSVRVQCMPGCTYAAHAAHSGDRAAPQQPGSGAPLPRLGHCGPWCAALTEQLLAAAALLAGGRAKRARDPDGSRDATHGPMRRVQQAAGQARASGDTLPAATPLPATLPRPEESLRHGAIITQLDIELKWRAHPQPPRLCAALAQLRTLRELTVSAGDPSHLRPQEFGAALQSLPALQNLSIRCTTFGDASHAAADALLQAVATLTQLSGLELADCIFFGTGGPSHVTRLASLPQLTSLAVGGIIKGPDYKDELVQTVSRMTALRELHVSMRATDTSEQYPKCQCACAGIVLQVCRATLQLTALQALGLPGLYLQGGGFLHLGKFHSALYEQNAPLLSRLTALNLTDAFDGSMESHVSAALALLADAPVLESLRLGYNGLRDGGLKRLACSPCLSRLRRLVLEQNGATGAGLCSVIQAAARGAAEGGHGLRELDISGNLIREQDAARLAANLPGLCSLEVLNIRHLFDSEAGLRAVVPALEALRQLRRLRVYKGWDYNAGNYERCGDAAVVAPLLTGLYGVHME